VEKDKLDLVVAGSERCESEKNKVSW